MSDQNNPKSLRDVLGTGYKKRYGLPPYAPLPRLPGGGLLSPHLPAPPPEAAPESPPAVTPEEAVDARLAAALASLEGDAKGGS